MHKPYNYRKEVVSPRDAASGLATGRRMHKPVTYNKLELEDAYDNNGNAEQRVLPTVNKIEGIEAPRDIASGMPTGKRLQQTGDEGCGPVTQTKTNSDGSVEEMTFSCAGDAASYYETTKQTPKTSFGEKIMTASYNENIVHRDLAARNIISGKLSWGADGQSGILTNKMINNSSEPNQPSYGTTVIISAREAGSGIATGRRSATAPEAGTGLATGKRSIANREAGTGLATGRREAGSGIATGRRQYEPLYYEGHEEVYSSAFASVKSNPLYKGNTHTTSNPMYENRINTPDCDDNGTGGITVSLVDAENGSLVATTKTERCGDFFFANVPDGNYAVRINSAVINRKGFDIVSTSSIDLLGSVETAEDKLQLSLNTEKQNDSTVTSVRRRVEVLKSSKDASPGAKVSRQILKTYFETGDTPSAAQRPGSPIGGIIVKGGKNPGGGQFILETDDDGEFEIEGLDAGNYRIIVEQTAWVDDEVQVTTGNSH
jgi:hypothetical protein